MKRISILSIVLLYSITTQAQTGEIKGKVVDTKGDPVPFAFVAVIYDEIGQDLSSTSTQSDEFGKFTIKTMFPGKHNLVAKGPGFMNSTSLYNKVSIGKTTTVDFTMLDFYETIVTTSISALYIKINNFLYFVDGSRTACETFDYRNYYQHEYIRIFKPQKQITDVNVYPNPSNGVFNIQTRIPHTEIVLVDINGKVIPIENPASSVINLSGYQDGFYFAKLKIGNKWKSIKFELKK